MHILPEEKICIAVITVENAYRKYIAAASKRDIRLQALAIQYDVNTNSVQVERQPRVLVKNIGAGKIKSHDTSL